MINVIFHYHLQQQMIQYHLQIQIVNLEYYQHGFFVLDIQIDHQQVLYDNNKKNLSELITKEMGKVISEAEAEAESTIQRINFFTENIKDFIKPEEIKVEGEENILYFEPIGCVGVITPWNYPLSLPIWSFAPNILIGNTMVFKPSELTSLVGVELVKIFNKHLPKIPTTDQPKEAHA